MHCEAAVQYQTVKRAAMHTAADLVVRTLAAADLVARTLAADDLVARTLAADDLSARMAYMAVDLLSRTLGYSREHACSLRTPKHPSFFSAIMNAPSSGAFSPFPAFAFSFFQQTAPFIIMIISIVYLYAYKKLFVFFPRTEDKA